MVSYVLENKLFWCLLVRIDLGVSQQLVVDINTLFIFSLLQVCNHLNLGCILLRYLY